MMTSQFDESQKQALTDLLILAMYSDGHLAAAEDSRLQRWLESSKFASDYDRQQYLDASFTRVSRQTGSAESVRAYAGQLAASFSRDQRRHAFDALQNLLASDGKFTPEEQHFLSMMKELLEM